MAELQARAMQCCRPAAFTKENTDFDMKMMDCARKNTDFDGRRMDFDWKIIDFDENFFFQKKFIDFRESIVEVVRTFLGLSRKTCLSIPKAYALSGETLSKQSWSSFNKKNHGFLCKNNDFYENNLWCVAGE